MNDTVHVVVVDDDDDDRALENLVHVAAFFYCLRGELGSQEILRYKKLCVWGVCVGGWGVVLSGKSAGRNKICCISSKCGG
jgi:hypothetical protein